MKNSVVMYLKMILSLFVTFFTTRIILKALGITDFGIYNLVAGAVSLLGFFNGSMSNTVQRYLAVGLGKGEECYLRQAFCISLTLNLVVAIFLLIFLELFGLWGFSSFFNIPADKEIAAFWGYQLMILITIVSTIATPYNASFNAHEDLALISVIEFGEILLKLVGAFCLMAYNGERLILYCFLLLVIQLVVFFTKVIYCHCHYFETRRPALFKGLDKDLLKDMLPFLGWNALESCSWLGKNQGIAVIMNSFYGTIVNAAYGVASQINGPLVLCSSTLLNSIRPQIYKSAGERNYGRMINLSIIASKFAFLVLLCVLQPFVFILPWILKVWLVTVPEYSYGFSLLLISVTIISYLSIGMNIAVQANGNVKIYQIVASIIILISLPIGYMVYSVSDNVYMFLIIMVVVECISVICKYFVASRILDIKQALLYTEIVMPCMFCLILCCITSYALYGAIEPGENVSLIAVYALTSFIVASVIAFYIGLKGQERQIIKSIFKSMYNYVSKR